MCIHANQNILICSEAYGDRYHHEEMVLPGGKCVARLSRFAVHHKGVAVGRGLEDGNGRLLRHLSEIPTRRERWGDGGEEGRERAVRYGGKVDRSEITECEQPYSIYGSTRSD